MSKLNKIANNLRKLAENPSRNFYYMRGYKGNDEYFFYKTNTLKNGNSYGYAIAIDATTNFKPSKPKRTSIYKTDVGRHSRLEQP